MTDKKQVRELAEKKGITTAAAVERLQKTPLDVPESFAVNKKSDGEPKPDK